MHSAPQLETLSQAKGDRPAASCLYEGTVRHRRFGPHAREFRYRVAMLYLDLEEAAAIFDGYWLWSHEKRNLVAFRRADHWGDPREPLEVSVRKLVSERLGRTPEGPIRLLTQPRFCGYVLNPISLFYCYQPDGATLDAVVAEVTNTPWSERCCYVIDADNSRQRLAGGDSTNPVVQAVHAKAMHVSPFLPMSMRYEWRLTPPGERLSVHIDDYEGDERRLDAALLLERRAISSRSLAGCLLRHPGLSLQVTAAIYWQALRLWWKGVPFVPHPKHGQAIPAAPD
jgi:hypothetical protein